MAVRCHAPAFNLLPPEDADGFFSSTFPVVFFHRGQSHIGPLLFTAQQEENSVPLPQCTAAGLAEHLLSLQIKPEGKKRRFTVKCWPGPARAGGC